MKNKKIILVAHLGDLSGANRSLVDLVSIYLKYNKNIMVFVPRKGPLSEKLSEMGVNYKVFLSGTWAANPEYESFFKKYIKIILNFYSENKMYRYFSKNKSSISLIHFNSIVYGVGARSLNRLGIPYIWHIREFPEENFKMKYYNKEKSMNIISKSQKVISISKLVDDYYKKLFDPKKIELVYNGINIDKSSTNYNNAQFSNSILMVGAISEDKGQFDAVKAIKLLKQNYQMDIKLFIVGEIIDKKYYDLLINYINQNDLKENIIFTGYSNNIESYREEISIALICSPMEAFGRVTIEGMYYKQLVIGANAGATKELIKNGINGFLYEVGNYDSLAARLKFTLENEDKINLIRENAFKEVIENFSIENTAEKIMSIYKELEYKDAEN